MMFVNSCILFTLPHLQFDHWRFILVFGKFTEAPAALGGARHM